jgi:hypothetical protein
MLPKDRDEYECVVADMVQQVRTARAQRDAAVEALRGLLAWVEQCQQCPSPATWREALTGDLAWTFCDTHMDRAGEGRQELEQAKYVRAALAALKEVERA